MNLAVLADDAGKIIAIAVCRLSSTGQVGTFTEDVEVKAEISRSQLAAARGQASSDYPDGDDLITSVIIELPSELEHMSLSEIQEQMVLERRDAGPALVRHAG
ncbi:hypothetical protein HUO13_35560 [Saccharopolyspora erythraea]|uniref:hypothetical protein n=1 Tax=Saccharopolyspora erythraea TaxID=1836 RepID=UPI001BAD4092|nr:hypothetical protein [Saccharopolyspora erythraea]QUH05392.1 hypothetical protein HUO13_35560 [Saccharopolyspora erythraea]